MDTTDKAMPARKFAPPVLTLRVLYTAGTAVARPPILLRPGGLVVGRTVTAEDGTGLCLAEDKRVSRVHAALQVAGADVRIIDLSQNNGTYVNRARVADLRLQDGDMIRIGDSFLLFRREAAPRPPERADAASEALLGVSPAIRAVRDALRLVGPTMASVLLLGDSGTGKEVAARTLHKLSGRLGPFVALNCSALPDTLAESQLFGHMRGAFTGALAQQAGLFCAAEKGTLFLDEVGELSVPVQSKLLRAIEERAVLPVGATATVATDCRLVAATNRDLAAAAAGGSFRGDLFARLAELPLRLPLLRDRREDILLLLEKALGQTPLKLPADLAELLLLSPWSYNVRELFKVAMELRIRSAGGPLSAELLADRLEALGQSVDAMKAPSAPQTPRAKAAHDVPVPDREQLLLLLTQHRGIITDLASAVGRSRTQVYRWLALHNIDKDQYRD